MNTPFTTDIKSLAQPVTAASFTPGPWKYGIANERIEQNLSYRGPGYYSNAGIFSGNQLIVGCDEYDIFDGKDEAERDANVRLILAAPELLAALDLLVKDVRGYEAWQRPCYAFDVAVAALMKARG